MPNEGPTVKPGETPAPSDCPPAAGTTGVMAPDDDLRSLRDRVNALERDIRRYSALEIYLVDNGIIPLGWEVS
jgi:hypothetical protein